MHIRRYILGWASCMYIIACAYTITRKTTETKSTCDQHVACVSLHVMIYLTLSPQCFSSPSSTPLGEKKNRIALRSAMVKGEARATKRTPSSVFWPKLIFAERLRGLGNPPGDFL